LSGKRELVFLFTAIFTRDVSLFEKIFNIMERRFGPVSKRSKIFNFTQTDYYTEEMGPGLKKIFFVFKKPISPERLIDIKLYTMKLESKFSARTLCLEKSHRSMKRRGEKRRVNLDPGYLSLSKVVLATHKDYAHRLYLGKGIYGEITLFFKDKTFTPFPWTFPDYRTPDYINFFNNARKLCYNKKEVPKE